MGELAAVAAVLAPAIAFIVDGAKRLVERVGYPLERVPDLIWPVLAAAVGVGGAFFFAVDVTGVPSRAPEAVVRVVVGLVGAGTSQGLFKGYDALRRASRRSGGSKPER